MDVADYYIGPREALIAQRLAKAAWFPEKPVLYRNGKLKRGFHISDPAHEAEIHLRDHRRGVWSVTIPVAKTERERREADHEREQTKRMVRENEHAQFLGPVVKKLRARYAGVRIVDARFCTTWDGDLRQIVRYQASLDLLKRYGLVTEAMLDEGRRTTDLGHDFLIYYDRWDSQSRPGCWDLEIFTGAVPYDPKRFSTRIAAALLKRMARAAKGPQ